MAPKDSGFYCYIGEIGGFYLQGRYGATQQEAVDNAVAAVRKSLSLTKKAKTVEELPIDLTTLGL